MIKTFIEVAPNGEVVSIGTGTIFNFAPTSPSNKLIELDEKVMLSEEYELHYDFNSQKLKKISRPHSNLIFDHSSEQWFNPRSLDELKEQRWEEIKTQRDSFEHNGFEFNGKIYDSDLTSQGRIIAAAQLGATVEWTLQDNSTIWLSPADLQGLVQALAQHVTSVHERGRIARQLIFEAETKEQVEAINL